MPRLTISLSNALYSRLSALSIHNKESMSNIINQLILAGMHHIEDSPPKREQQKPLVDQHCQKLIIQMNALVKNLSKELLHFNQNDFKQLQQASAKKYNELNSANSDVA
ncbi:Uncharacterised protein [Legionella donaldsonii]|uniref:Uncharacterized protein n=1 Tax=Legionella donaldsonii TaxID=45060 RepID=A0A378J2I7_9GAMM|nr:hypothetical protein [Legionella donaldsonii]STX41127.1 Uncharacterised protein [Legionella donaldsonii]